MVTAAKPYALNPASNLNPDARPDTMELAQAEGEICFTGVMCRGMFR